MMCQIIGRSPTMSMGLGRNSVSSRRRVPFPPQRITTGMFVLITQAASSGGALRGGLSLRGGRHLGLPLGVVAGVVVPVVAVALLAQVHVVEDDAEDFGADVLEELARAADDRARGAAAMDDEE